jgi:hypothetical protein
MSITASEDAIHTAIDKMNTLIAAWKTFNVDQRVIDIANKYLSPAQANELINLVRNDLTALDMDNQLSAIAATLGSI